MASISEAVVGNALAWSQVAETLQKAEESKAQTQERILNVLTGRRALQNSIDYQNALQQEQSPPVGGGAVPGASSGATPGIAVPAGPPSIAATRDIERDPNAVMVKQLMRDKENFQRNFALAQRYGQPTTQWVTALDSVNTRLREVNADLSKRQAEDFKETAQVIASIDSPQGADAALRHIADTFGGDAAMGVYRKLQVNPADGQPLWNDSNKRIFQQYENQFTSMNDKASQKNAAMTYELNLNKAAEQARHNLQNELHGDQTVAATREGIAASNARNAARIAAAQSRLTQYLNVTGLNFEAKRVQEDQTVINKLGDKYNIIPLEKGAEVAERVEAKLLNPKQGYAAVTAPEARSVVEQYKQMVNNFRTRASSVEQEREVSRMNGVLQKAGKYLSTWGEGDKLVEKDVMLQVTKEMKTLAADANADLLKAELNVLQNTNKKGGNASFITMRGDLDRAIATGRAKKVTVDGKNYAVIVKPGQKPGPSDMFELPTAPEGRANRFLAPPSENVMEE